MANLEDNFTRFPNELLERLYSIRLSGLMKDVVLCLIRYSYGYGKDAVELSVRFLAKKLNSSPPRITEALNKLFQDNIILIVREANRDHTARILKLNEDFLTWKQFENEQQFENKKQFENRQEISSKTGNRNSSKTGNNIKKEKKENIKKAENSILDLIPTKLQTDSFITVWREWIDYRKELKKPLKESTAKKQLKFLSQQSEPELIIEKSIMNGWQGLFPIKEQTTNQPKVIKATI